MIYVRSYVLTYVLAILCYIRMYVTAGCPDSTCMNVKCMYEHTYVHMQVLNS